MIVEHLAYSDMTAGVHMYIRRGKNKSNIYPIDLSLYKFGLPYMELKIYNFKLKEHLVPL